MPESFDAHREVAARLHGYQEYDDPRVAFLAQFLAFRIGEGLLREGATPHTFFVFSTLALGDLRNGFDSSKKEPITGDHPLIGLSQTEYEQLIRRVPDIARVGFSEDFAQSVQGEIERLSTETADESPLAEGEIIAEPITTIGDALHAIVGNAQMHLLDLDWEGTGVSLEWVKEWYGPGYCMLLREAPFTTPINLLMSKVHEEQKLLEACAPHQKRELVEGYWLAMMQPQIPPDYAMATRDFIVLQMIDLIAVQAGLNAARVYERFTADTNGPAMRAAKRLRAFMAANPQLIKDASNRI